LASYDGNSWTAIGFEGVVDMDNGFRTLPPELTASFGSPSPYAHGIGLSGKAPSPVTVLPLGSERIRGRPLDAMRQARR